MLAACSGGGSPNAPSSPTPSGHSVAVVLFYDENGNGVLDGAEGVRIPDAIVEIGGKQGRSAALSGEAVVEGVASGAQTVSVRASSLPPYYEPPASVPITVPATATTFIPLTLPIGSNHPNVYLAFGDSITGGEGSTDGEGYTSILQRKLQAHLGQATILKDASSATRSNRGAERLPSSLSVGAAYTLIHYGTNDWNMSECKSQFPCFTIDSLRSMVRAVKARQGLPILATIIPANPIVFAQQPERNLWVAEMDTRIRAMAREEDVPLAEMEPVFIAKPFIPGMYVDHIHPSDAGYEAMAEAFFEAIVHSSAAAAASDARGAQLFEIF